MAGVVGENTREEQSYRKGQDRAHKDSAKGDLDARLEAVADGHNKMKAARDRYYGDGTGETKDLKSIGERMDRDRRDREENRRIGGYSKGGKVSTGAKREYPKGKC